VISNDGKNLKSQFATSSWGGRRTKPYVFTEQGVAMLSSPLPPPAKPRKKIGFIVKEKKAAYGKRTKGSRRKK
jgi:hypothetical protein